MAACIATAVLVLAGIPVARRGVVWPWTPTAHQVTPACAAVQAAGLDQYWPSATRWLERDKTNRHDLADCWWRSNDDQANKAPFDKLTASVHRHNGDRILSPIGNAVLLFDNERRLNHAARPLPGLGDEAIIANTGDHVSIAARRANVTTSITIYPTSPANRKLAETTATALTAAILNNIDLT